MIHHKKRSPGEPWVAAGMDSLMSFAATQMAAGRPRPKITNSVQSRTGKCLGALSSKVVGLFMGERRPNERYVSSYRALNECCGDLSPATHERSFRSCL